MAEVVYSLQVQEVGAAQHPTVGETRVGAPGDSRGPAAASSVVETDKLSVDNAYQGTEFRSPSPEYVDAVQEQQQEDQEREVEAMGETTTRRDTNEVESSRVDGIQRLALPRDPTSISSSSSDLGVGIKVAGGVKCDKCGELHTLITDITTDLPNEAHLYKGLAVLEWCGHSIDGVSYEEVRRVLSKTEQETSVELAVKDCRGRSPEAEGDEDKAVSALPTSNTVTSQQPPTSSLNSLSSPRHSPSDDREPSYTPKSLSPTPSPIHSRTCTPPSHSTDSTPSPTPPPSPNLHRRGPPKKHISEPRPASVNIPTTLRPAGEMVAPKFMINDVPTSPPQEEGPTKLFTVESFLGSASAASIHMSLRYREDENHLRILLHEVKGTKRKGPKSSATPQTHYFINAYLFPDLDKQGVRACEVLSHVSDLENPQFYTVTRQQLKSVALRVILWEAKNNKHSSFVGEVLVSLSDRGAVKLEGQPSWFTMCKTDPNLPPLPPVVLVKKPKKEDIFHRVRRGTGYALQSLRRPMSMGIEALAAENGRLSPSASMDNLESSFKKLAGANVTMPRRTRKERRPLTGLFNSPPHIPGPPLAATTVYQNGASRTNHREMPNGVADVPRVDPWDEGASLSVPTSPLLTRRAARDGGTLRRKKLGGILSVLRGSLLPTTHSLDLTHSQKRRRAATEAGEEMTDGEGGVTEEDKKRRWSLSGDVKHRIAPISPPFSPTTISPSSAFSSPQRRPLTDTPSSSALDPAHRRVHSELASTDDYKWAAEPVEDLQQNGGTTDLLGLEKHSGALLSDGSWYSAEEDLKDDETLANNSRPSVECASVSVSASKLPYSRPSSMGDGVGVANKGVTPANKVKSRSADNILESLAREEKEEFRTHQPLTRTRCAALSGESSGSSVEEDYATANSRPLSRSSGSDEPDMGGARGGVTDEESSLDISTRLKAIGRVNAISSRPEFRALEDRENGPTSGGVASSGERISRWRSFEDLLGALPLQKRRLRWLRRNRTHRVSSSTSTPSPLLKRRRSEPAFSQGPPVGKVRLELTFNPETSMIGVRLHEHTLSVTKTDLMVHTYLYSRVSVESQKKTVSFKKADYSHTLVASFTCNTNIADLTLRVSLETSGRFFSRQSGHVLLDLGPLLSLSCNQWFPLYHAPCCPPPNDAHQQET